MSLRWRILLLVLLLAVVPLALIGLWSITLAARSGETLLRTRLDAALDETAAELNAAWTRQRSLALDLAEGDARDLLRTGADTGTGTVMFAGAAQHVVLTDSRGRVRWQSDAGTGQMDMLPLRVDVHESPLGARTGTLELGVPIADLFSELRIGPAAVGTVLGIFDARGRSLLPAPFDPQLLTQPRFRWGGDDWMTASRSVIGPDLTLVAGAPLTPYTQPFHAAAARGAWVLLLVAALGVALAVLITRRMTQSLETLVLAAEAVAAGQLERSVPADGRDEVGRVARAFNLMTASLRQTLRRLTEQRSLALVGEFAAGLAHEVRNPLTAIRVNLQLAEEQLPQDSPARAFQRAALADIQRLDATVSGALHTARSGRVQPAALSLHEPITRAHRAAAPTAASLGVELTTPPTALAKRAALIDPAAVEQLFLNLLLNAVQASGPGDRVTIELGDDDGGTIHVVVRDTGAGMSDDVIRHAFDPLFTTRTDGTGLGLAIARRIAEAHGGALELESAPGAGTAAHVRLPLSRSDH